MVGLRITSLFPTLSAVSGARGLWLPAAALTGEGPKPRLPRVPAVDNCSVGDDVVQRAAITSQQDAEEAHPQQDEAQRKRERSHEPASGACPAAVLADN